MFQKDPKITNAIRSIKNYLKQLPPIERHNKAIRKKHDSQMSILQKPLLEEYTKIKSTLGFKYGKIYLTGWKSYKEAVAVLPYPTRKTPSTDVSGFCEFDTTLIHILYNRLRDSTKPHLGSKEKDDLYVARYSPCYSKVDKVVLPQYRALSRFVDSLVEISLEAHKEPCDAT